MKLNHKCIRYLLLAIEERIPLSGNISISDFYTDKYSNNEVMYAATKLLEAGYINAKPLYNDNGGCAEMFISSLTWNGHELLDNIRDDNIWNKTLGILSNLTSTSVSIMSNVAGQVLAATIKSYIGL